jgi:hypothetical protein
MEVTGQGAQEFKVWVHDYPIENTCAVRLGGQGLARLILWVGSRIGTLTTHIQFGAVTAGQRRAKAVMGVIKTASAESNLPVVPIILPLTALHPTFNPARHC